MLEALTRQGFRYLFVSNVDNLGAGLDLKIPAWMHSQGIPFLMEVADRTEVDRKGGHLARLHDGRLVLREVAMCPEDEREDFQDVQRHRYFNTNNLWVDLSRLQGVLQRCGGLLDLPLIVNRKRVVPADPDSPEVFQLETAMGSAISVFDGAQALRVPRIRFAPVKTLEDLLAVRSDAFELTRDHRIRLCPERRVPPRIRLDPEVYRTVEDLERHTPCGPPGLRACSSLSVHGEVTFGQDVTCEGEVEVQAASPWRVPDGALLSGSVRKP
jgi:UTP--glucose-1-phosphate uridylyltransferase